MLKSILAFIRACCWAIAVAGLPFLTYGLVFVLAASADGEPDMGLLILALMLVMVAATAIGAMLAIGLPATLILAATGRESKRAYGWTGALGGAVFASGALMLLSAGSPAQDIEIALWFAGFAALGAAAGTAAAIDWAKYRLRREPRQRPSAKPNPIHELLH